MRRALFLLAVAWSGEALAGPFALSPADEARQSLRSCAEGWVTGDLFTFRGENVRDLLSHSPTTKEGQVASRVTAARMGGCLSSRPEKWDNRVGRLQFSPMLLRGGLFEALYRRRQKAGKTPVLITTPDQPYWRVAADDGFVALQQFGECVARGNTADAHSLLFTKVGGGDETQAFKALSPALAACVPGGSKIAFSRGLIEGVIAEGLYHLTGGNADQQKAAS